MNSRLQKTVFEESSRLLNRVDTNLLLRAYTAPMTLMIRTIKSLMLHCFIRKVGIRNFWCRDLRLTESKFVVLVALRNLAQLIEYFKMRKRRPRRRRAFTRCIFIYDAARTLEMRTTVSISSKHHARYKHLLLLEIKTPLYLRGFDYSRLQALSLM